MSPWNPFPHTADYALDAPAVLAHWERLHRGDAEPAPKPGAVLSAWVLFHQGEFQKAEQAGLKARGAGLTVANKAASMYATYLETTEKKRQALYLDVAQRAAAQAADNPNDPNAHYWHGYALGRYTQGISVAKALALGLGRKVKTSLETTLKLEPRHADAHLALGMFHAEVIDKVGPLIGAMTYGAKKETGLSLLQAGLKLNPASPIGLMEYGNGLVMLEGDKKLKEATEFYEKAAACVAVDATERLEVDMARAELAD